MLTSSLLTTFSYFNNRFLMPYWMQKQKVLHLRSSLALVHKFVKSFLKNLPEN